MSLEWMAPPVLNHTLGIEQPLPSMTAVYSIPALLLLLVLVIVKWRPCYEFTGIAHCCRWYFACCSKETKEEVTSCDRQRILIIDAESLAFEDDDSLSEEKADMELQPIHKKDEEPIRISIQK